MEFKKLLPIIVKAEDFQVKILCERSEILILLKENDFQSLFDELAKNIPIPNETIVPTMYKCYGFEFRPHNIENQDVLICLKHNVK